MAQINDAAGGRAVQRTEKANNTIEGQCGYQVSGSNRGLSVRQFGEFYLTM
jgi:hypothetical protein